MADSIREQILTAVHTKLAAIKKTNGYNSNMGKEPFRSFLPSLDFDILPCVGFQVGTEENLTDKSLERLLPVQVQGISKFGTLKPYEVAEQLYADIVECMIGVDWSLGFDSGGTYQITVGSTIEGATSGAQAYVRSVSKSSGTWAGGDAAGTLTLRKLNSTDFQDNEQLNIGSNSNVATVNGTISGTSHIETTTNNLATNILLLTCEVILPDVNQKTVGVNVGFSISYRTIDGNPYLQTTLT